MCNMVIPIRPALVKDRYILPTNILSKKYSSQMNEKMDIFLLWIEKLKKKKRIFENEAIIIGKIEVRKKNFYQAKNL